MVVTRRTTVPGDRSNIDAGRTSGNDCKLDVDMRRSLDVLPAVSDGDRVTVLVSVTTVTECSVSVLDFRRMRVSVLDIRRRGARAGKLGMSEKSRSEMSGTLALRLNAEESGRLRVVPGGEMTCWTGMLVRDGARRSDGTDTSRTESNVRRLVCRGSVADSVT